MKTNFRAENRHKAEQMINRGVELKVLSEENGKILVMNGLRRKWVDKQILVNQIANDRKMMNWLDRLVGFSEKVSNAASEDVMTGKTTTFSTSDIPTVR